MKNLHNYDPKLELAVCLTCGGGEGSLPTDCPGRKMTQLEDQEVYRGELDFKGGKWWRPVERHVEVTDFEAVGAFHSKFGIYDVVKSGPWPRPLTEDVLQFRLKFLVEELCEYANAVGCDVHFKVSLPTRSQDLAKAADALVDLSYVALGTAHLHGFPWPALFAEVQRANMAKERCQLDHPYDACGDNSCEFCGDTPKCHHENRDTGTLANLCGEPRVKHSLRGSINDVIKPEGWRPPDVVGVLRRFGWKG